MTRIQLSALQAAFLAFLTGTTPSVFGQTANPPAFYICSESQLQQELLDLRPLFPHLGMAVLQDIKTFEQRPKGTLGEWAIPLHRRYMRSCHILASGEVEVGKLQEELQRRAEEARKKLWGSADGDRYNLRSDEQNNLSIDEQEVQRGGVQLRLIQLAITGRISKDEFDSLVRRLQGN